MNKVEKGDLVSVVYDGLLSNNEVFESSKDTGPLEFRVGENSVLPGFENAVLGMTEEEEKTINLVPDEAYGPKKEELIHTVNRKVFGEKIDPQPGMVLGLTINRDGHKEKVPAMVTEISGENVTVDFNHPLAGRTLTYKITIKEIKKQK